MSWSEGRATEVGGEVDSHSAEVLLRGPVGRQREAVGGPLLGDRRRVSVKGKAEGKNNGPRWADERNPDAGIQKKKQTPVHRTKDTG
ncbi:Hypothetical predicted protein, partial [Pelobates cultripes]